MDAFTDYHALTERIVWLAGSDKVAHMHAGLGIYMLAQICLRTRRASGLALRAVLVCEIANEILDRCYWGSWRWRDTAGDFGATLFWPTALYLLARFRRARWSALATTGRSGLEGTSFMVPSRATSTLAHAASGREGSRPAAPALARTAVKLAS